MKLSEIGQAALERVRVDDGAYSEAIRALQTAAPEHTDLILRLESEASRYALDAMEQGFIIGVSVATSPLRWLLTV